MTEPVTPRVDVSVGDVSHSQLIIGNHNTVQTPKGTEVTFLQVGERPTPRPRPTPVDRRPAEGEVFGRDEEVSLVASARPDAPVQLYGRDGSGKTSLLKFVARQAPLRAEGVVFEATRNRTLDEIQAKLYTAFWETEAPFLPAPAEIGGFLADREALLVLDDCSLDRDDLATLLDGVPRCTVAIASAERTLWSSGTARALGPLGPEAALELFQRELGGTVDAADRVAAETLVERLDWFPQSVVEAAAMVADGVCSVRELADDPTALAQRDLSALSAAQKRIVEVLSALEGAIVGVEHVSALADAPGAAAELRRLDRHGWVKAGSPRYGLQRRLPVDAIDSRETKLAERVLAYWARWSGEARPSEVASEAEAIEGALDLAAAQGHREEQLALALSAEAKLMVAGSWNSSLRVLSAGLGAACDLDDDAARAHLLHQLGSLAICVDRYEVALAHLEEALRLRERLGDREGAELTRHNLGELGNGSGRGDGDGRGGGGKPWYARFWPGLGVLAALVGVLAAVLLAGGDGSHPVRQQESVRTQPGGHEDGKSGTGTTGEDGSSATGQDGSSATDGATSSTTDRGTSQPVDEEPPSIGITSPQQKATYAENELVTAEYTCTDTGPEEPSCEGSVASGEPIDTSRPGVHEFVVTSRDRAGNDAEQVVIYLVAESESEKSTTEAAPIE